MSQSLELLLKIWFFTSFALDKLEMKHLQCKKWQHTEKRLSVFGLFEWNKKHQGR
jgi:hypothetical protein